MNNENTIYDNESTQYQSQANEPTQYDDNNTNEQVNNQEPSKNGSTWKSAAVGVGTGVLLGSVATLFTSGQAMGSTGQNASVTPEKQEHPEWTDGNVEVAESVNDEMSFGEAFGTARTEVGAGGVFEWRGNIYSTYTEEEWNAMTPEQRNEYGSHFNWESDPDTGSGTAQTTQTETTQTQTAQTETTQTQTTGQQQETTQTVEVIDVQPLNPEKEEAVLVSYEEPEVEVLGVVHDDETGANIGGMMVDGQEVVFVDVDNDGVFDLMASDRDGNQQLSENEIIDISADNVTVNDFGGMSPTEESMLADGDNNIDYIDGTGVYDA